MCFSKLSLIFTQLKKGRYKAKHIYNKFLFVLSGEEHHSLYISETHLWRALSWSIFIITGPDEKSIWILVVASPVTYLTFLRHLFNGFSVYRCSYSLEAISQSITFQPPIFQYNDWEDAPRTIFFFIFEN